MTEPEETQATFELPDCNTAEVQKAIEKQDGPAMLDWAEFGEVTARVTRVKRSRPGVAPKILIDGVIISTVEHETGQPFKQYKPESEMRFCLPIGPGPYDGIQHERAATLANFVRAVFGIAPDAPVDMSKLEALINAGRVADKLSAQMQFVFTRRKQGQPKKAFDKKTGEVTMRQYGKDTVRAV